jgi:hypothetical protein
LRLRWTEEASRDLIELAEDSPRRAAAVLAAGSDPSVLPGTKTKAVAKIGPANSSGNLRFRIGGSGNSRGSTQTNLTTLPATYSAGATWSSGQMSVYLTT